MHETFSILFAAVHFEDSPEAVPLGAACAASALKRALEAQNSVSNRKITVSLSLIEAFTADVLMQKIQRRLIEKTAKPQGIGFSLYSWNRAVLVKAAERLRKETSGIMLFCGGPEAAALPQGLHTSQGGPFDVVIRGEGETAAARLAAALREKLEPPHGTAVQDPVWVSQDELIRLPSPWLDGTLKAENRKGILWELARGCPYKCKYCYESKGSPEVRYFSEERLRQEVRLFIEAKVPYVFVLDPTFNSDKSRAVRLLGMIEQETKRRIKAHNEPEPKIHWHFEVRAEQLDREQARRFARLGASLQIGLQTADPKVAGLAGRSFKSGLFASKIGLLNEEGVIFGLDLLYGLPGDSLAGYWKSLDFALSLYPNNLDMFRLSLLPGTRFADDAEALGLEAQPEAPYQVTATRDFSASDLDYAEKVSQAADLFYNQGRAVAWFNQILGPLHIKPSNFLEGFADYCKQKPAPADSLGIESLQLAYLNKQYQQAGKAYLLPAITDIVRFHGAWARALAEGITATLNFNYHPDTIISAEALDIEAFIRHYKPCPARIRIAPGKTEPEIIQVYAH